MANPDHSKSVKPEKFSGIYFKRWANQMKYWLTTLGLISVIDDSIPAPSPAKSSPAETLQLIPPISIWNLRRLTIIVSIGFLVHSLIVYMTFIINIKMPKNYRQHLGKNITSTMLESKDSPPPINSWCLTVNLSMINFMNLRFYLTNLQRVQCVMSHW